MLFRLDEEIDWQRGDSPIEIEVKNQIQKIKEEYFSENTMGFLKLIYPKGEPEEVHRVFGVLKKYPIDLKSSDGVWRWSKGRPRMINGRRTYDDHHFFITHKTVFKEKDIELVWYLKHKASPVRTGKLYFENLEEDAKRNIEEIAQDVDIKFALMSPRSPISKDEVLIKQVAKIFGVRDVDKRSVHEVKLDILDKVMSGQKHNDPFVNFETFDTYTQGETKRKHAFVATRAIQEGYVGFKGKKWYIMHGREFGEDLFDVKASEVPDRNQIFVDMVVNDPNIRARVFNAMNEEEITTAEDLRELKRPTLQKLAKEEIGEFSPKDTVEDLVEKICKHRGIDYEKP